MRIVPERMPPESKCTNPLIVHRKTLELFYADGSKKWYSLTLFSNHDLEIMWWNDKGRGGSRIIEYGSLPELNRRVNRKELKGYKMIM